MKKGVLVLLAGFALAIASAAPARATDVITFDPDGGGPIAAASIDVLDIAPGNLLSQGLNASSPAGTVGSLLFQANLANATVAGNPAFGFSFGAPGNPAFTVVAGLSERVVSNSGPVATIGPTGPFSDTITFGAPLSPASQGFFYIYAQSANGSNLNGTGFTGATPILSGMIENNADFAGTFTVTNISCTNPADPSTCTPATQNLDQFGSNNYSGPPNVTTVLGGGNTNLDVIVTGVNSAYFPNLVVGTSLIFATTEQTLPFKQADPSACFSSDGHTSCDVAGAGGAGVGTVNGAGRDTILQSDPSLSFQGVSAIPEPASLTLLGLGLFGSAAARRRQKKNASK